MKITKKTAMLFGAVLLILAVTAAIVIGQHLSGKSKDKVHLVQSIEPLLIGHGFAQNADGYHILDINAVKISNAPPGLIRSLLSQKKSTEEIAKELNQAQILTVTRAHLRFAGQAYALNITGYDNKSLTGEVLTLPPHGANQTGFTPAAVGNISLSISIYEGEMLSTGTLIINGTNYKVLLTSPMNLKRLGGIEFREKDFMRESPAE